jgi:hypothetical protein
MITKIKTMQPAKKMYLLILSGILYASCASGQQLFKSVSKKGHPRAVSSPIPPRIAPTLPVAAATAAPAITGLDITTATTGDVVTITGTEFGGTTAVSFGGTAAAMFTVDNTTTITAVVGTGASGSVIVTNAFGSSVPFPGFTFTAAAAPTVINANPSSAQPGETVTITGTNFTGTTSVKFGTTDASSFTVTSSTTIEATVAAGSGDGITVTNVVGASPTFNGFTFTKEAGESTPAASADFTIPDVGQSNLNIIVTPSFFLNKVYYASRLGISGAFWGNSFGTDSLKQKTGSKILLPQASMIGFKLEGVYSFSDTSASTQFGATAEVNLLFKKISYFDVTTESSTNFTPFVVHPKIGLMVSAFNANVFVAVNYNFLTVQTENKKFIDFFDTKNKTVFAYPEINLSGIFDVSGNAKQSVKVSFDLLFNNKQTKYISQSTDSLVPYLKIGFLSRL